MADAGSRTFYGGEPLMGAAGGEISTGKYDGPEAHEHAPWKCPACGVENEGALQFGCVHCGSGKPGYHVGQPDIQHQTFLQSNLGDPPPVEEPSPMYLAAAAWCEAHPEVSAIEAFVAGYRLARLQMEAQVLAAPPVTADTRTLAPHTKAQRTIIAALEIFKDQILSQDPEEIASGEWMSVDEVDELLATLRAQL
jgi:hypothetical protein